jgi:Anti-sigma-K factor rskA
VAHVDLEILALLALERAGGTDEDTRHLVTCDVCRAQLSRLAETVALARSEEGSVPLEAPPAQVWSRITAELAVAELGPPQGARAAAGADLASIAAARPAAADGPRASGPRRRWWYRPALIAAAGLIVGAGAATAVQQLGTVPPPPVTVVGRAALQPLPQFPRWRHASGIAVMEEKAGGRLLAVTLRAPASGGFFEVWLLGRDGTKMISLGDLNGAGTGVFIMPPGVDLGFYSRIDISLQPFNGSTAHSKVSVVRGSLPGS